MSAPTVAVVGGGIAGVAAAHAVRSVRPDVEVTVFEGADRLGGKLTTIELAGVQVDAGAEAFLNRRPEAVALARDVGLGDRLVHPEPGTASIWSRARMHPVPPSVLGVPSDLGALAASGLLSRAGLARAYADLPRRVPRRDVSIASFVAARLGQEVVDRLVEPLLGGVYAGHASQLSLRAAAPQVLALAEHGRRVARTAARTRTDSQQDPVPVFAGLTGGVGTLPEAVAVASGATVRTGATVRAMTPTPTGAWDLVVGPTTAEEHVHADAVVLAVPAAPAARLVAASAPAAARALREITYASMAVVSLVVPRAAIRADLAGSGFLVPPVDGRTIKAATYSSQKWAWVGGALGADLVAVRTSIGRAGEEGVLQRDDAGLVATAVDDLSDAIGLHGPLVDAQVTRWGGALPQYTVGHPDRVATIESAVAGIVGLEVCGAAYHGIGIPAVIATAQAAAARTVACLPPTGSGAGQ